MYGESIGIYTNRKLIEPGMNPFVKVANLSSEHSSDLRSIAGFTFSKRLDIGQQDDARLRKPRRQSLRTTGDAAVLLEAFGGSMREVNESITWL